MREKLICGLDIGTVKTCAVCGTADASGKIDILASLTIPTQGSRSGRIVDSKKLSACIREATKRLRKMCGINFYRVYANIDSPDIRAKIYEQETSFADDAKIKKSQIEKLVNSIVLSDIPLDRRVIHIDFRDFILDNQLNSSTPLRVDGERDSSLRPFTSFRGSMGDPERSEGSRSESSIEVLKRSEGRSRTVKIVIVSALIPTINSFRNSIKDAGLILEDMVPSGCAQALSLVRSFKQDSEKTNILIDFGAGLTKITLLKDKLVKDLVILPVGAQSITEDIAVKLKLTFECAEELKIKYGRVIWENEPHDEKIIVRDKQNTKVIQSQKIDEIVRSKADYLLQETNKVLLALNFEEEKVDEIIVMGGGSILEGFLERAEKVLDKPVKMGFLYAVNDSHIQAQSALYATSMGLIRYGLNKRTKLSKFYSRIKFSPFADMINRGRGLYREYF